MFSYTRSRVTSLALAAILIVGLIPSAAFGGINDMPSPLGTSQTNPSDPSDPDHWWRQGWGNSVFPQFELEAPPGTSADTEPFLLGNIYVVDRNPFTEIDETNPDAYDHSWNANGTVVNNTIDMVGIYEMDPVGLAATEPGAKFPWEGWWEYHWSFFDNTQVATRTVSGGFGIDVTPPLPVSKITARPSAGYVGPVGVYFPTGRANVSWEDKEYDLLSGVAKYDVYLNGELIEHPVFHLGHTTTSITIEDLLPGKNTIEVKTVDRATNVGPGVKTYFYSDPDVPTVKITAPADNGYVGVNATFKADAKDLAGIQSVKFALNGVVIGTDTSAPYSLTKNLSAYSAGPHTITATAKDMYGREVSTTHTFLIDKTIPTLTGFSAAPNPFFPVLKDGYKDTMTVKFTTNENVTAHLYVYESRGRVIRHISGPVAAGTRSIVWDGADWSGKVSTGSFSLRVAVVDKGGNTTWSPRVYTTIRDYEIVRIAPNAVRIIPR